MFGSSVVPIANYLSCTSLVLFRRRSGRVLVVPAYICAPVYFRVPVFFFSLFSSFFLSFLVLREGCCTTVSALALLASPVVLGGRDDALPFELGPFRRRSWRVLGCLKG